MTTERHTTELDAVLLSAHLATLRVSIDSARQAVAGLGMMSARAARAATSVSPALPGLLAWWREDLARLEAEEARVLTPTGD